MSIFLLILLVFYITWFAATLAGPPTNARFDGVRSRVAPRISRELDKQGMSLGSPIFIRIFKESRELEVWVENGERFDLFKTYRICTFSGDLGPKLRQGDNQAPEGFYFVNPSRMNPASRFHLSFNLGYPNMYDRAHGRTGAYLMVHGDCVSIGCYAMTDAGIEEIYTVAEDALRKGQPFFRVHVFPFRMTEQNMKRHAGSRWIRFWENLREGHDHFEKYGRPPNVEVIDRRYVFEKE